MPYFDNNATTPLRESARKAWLETVSEHWQNPSSPYRSAARARNKLEAMRERVAELMGCARERVIFTGGATEANNAVLRHAAQTGERGQVLISAVEHPCIYAASRKILGDKVEILPVSKHGQVDIDALGRALRRQRWAMVSIMAANNETGVTMSWKDVQQLCRNTGVPYHCDAAQWIGKMPLGGLAECDYVTASAHKFGGPKGVGFILAPTGEQDFGLLAGGDQEHGRRAGTEDLPSIAAMIAALEDAIEELSPCLSAEQEEQRDIFEAIVKADVAGLQIVGEKSKRLWNTSLLIMPRFENFRWVARLDMKGFEVSTGSACATGKEGPSHVLTAMGFSSEEARRAVRVSACSKTPVVDWQELAIAIRDTWRELREEQGPANVIEI